MLIPAGQLLWTAVVVDTATGQRCSTHVAEYRHESGLLGA